MNIFEFVCVVRGRFNSARLIHVCCLNLFKDQKKKLKVVLRMQDLLQSLLGSGNRKSKIRASYVIQQVL